MGIGMIMLITRVIYSLCRPKLPGSQFIFSEQDSLIKTSAFLNRSFKLNNSLSDPQQLKALQQLHSLFHKLSPRLAANFVALLFKSKHSLFQQNLKRCLEKQNSARELSFIVHLCQHVSPQLQKNLLEKAHEKSSEAKGSDQIPLLYFLIKHGFKVHKLQQQGLSVDKLPPNLFNMLVYIAISQQNSDLSKSLFNLYKQKPHSSLRDQSNLLSLITSLNFQNSIVSERLFKVLRELRGQRQTDEFLLCLNNSVDKLTIQDCSQISSYCNLFRQTNQEILQILQSTVFHKLNGQASEYSLIAYLIERNKIFSQLIQLAHEEQPAHSRLILLKLRNYNQHFLTAFFRFYPNRSRNNLIHLLIAFTRPLLKNKSLLATLTDIVLSHSDLKSQDQEVVILWELVGKCRDAATGELLQSRGLNKLSGQQVWQLQD